MLHTWIDPLGLIVAKPKKIKRVIIAMQHWKWEKNSEIKHWQMLFSSFWFDTLISGIHESGQTYLFIWNKLWQAMKTGNFTTMWKVREC